MSKAGAVLSFASGAKHGTGLVYYTS